jgi:NodT family efflux transporter outer membrane factor (OMF) lipoprotein
VKSRLVTPYFSWKFCLSYPSKNGLALIVSLGLGACAVGPDFKKPDAPKVSSFTEKPVSNKLATAPGVGGTQQSIEPAADIPAEWWALYRSPELDNLIKQALKRNPNLGAADATLRAAQENANAAFGSFLFPSIGLGGSATRQQINPSTFGQGSGSPSIYNIYNTSVSVNYNLDVFGGARRAVQSAEAQAEISGFQLEGAYLNLTANIVTTAIREAALRAQYESNLEIYEAQKNLADIIAKQLEIGTASRVDLTSQVSLAASSQIDLLNLNKNLSFTRNQLSVLVGEFPGNGVLAKFDLNKLNLPEKIPLSVPSDLVRQRPDIRAAEAYIKSTNALVGVATANLLPQITLSGATGSQALTTGALFGPNAAIWSVAGGVFQPLFQGGALLAQRRGAIATNEAAVFQYQATVLSAFQEVANALQALESDALALRAASEAERNALEYLNLLEQQYKLGTGSYLAVLIAQRQYQQTKFRLIDAQANRFANTAALFVALGGGWWNRTGPAYQAQKKEDLHNQGSSQQEMRQ